MCGREGRIEEEWQKDMEGKTLILSGRVSRWVHSGESSADGCKMHNSMVTEGDGGSSEKRNKAREREGDRSERGALRKKGGRKSERRKKKAGGREVSRQTEGDGTDMAGGGALWQVLHHLLRHCQAARKQSLGFSREQPSS